MQKLLKWIKRNKGLFFVSLLFLTAPLLANAAIFTDIFNVFSVMLEGISEMVGPFKSLFVLLLLGLLVSGLALHLSIYLLEWASDPAKLEIIESEVVQIGWQFTSSLANTGIIIALVVIGIATILNKESYTAKKTLPKLIIVALLVNFSLVFVGMIVDVSNIILNTFYTPGLGEDLVEAIFLSWESILTQFSTYLTSLMISLIIPASSPIVQAGVVAAFTGAFLPQIVAGIMQVITGFLISGILFIYAFLFFARIFVIQLLAIFSPLAFVAWSVPGGKKHWSKWINALIEWSFLGVVLFFFLLLSTVAANPLRPDYAGQGDPGASIFTNYAEIVPSIFIYYITLAIFLGVAVVFAKKMMPKGSDAILKVPGKVKEKALQVTQKNREVAARRLKTSFAENKTDNAISQKQQAMENSTGLEKGFNAVSYGYRKGMRKFSSFLTTRSPESTVKGERDNQSKIIEDYNEEELRSVVNSANSPRQRRIAAAQKLAEDGDIEKQEVRDIITEYWSDISDKVKRDLKKSSPEIHLDLAATLEEGAQNMLEEIDKMSGSDVKDLSFTGPHASRKAAMVMRDPSKLQSLGSANYNKKANFMKAVTNLSDNDLEGVNISTADTYKSLKNHLSNDKNLEKWPTDLVEDVTDSEDSDDGYETSSGAGTDQDGIGII